MAEPLAQLHPIVHLARAHLTGSSRIRHVPMISAADFHVAVARFGGGLDHVGGETPIAMVKIVPDRQQASRGIFVDYVVTDRRIFGRAHMSDTANTFADVPYAQLGPLPAAPGSLAQSLDVPVGYVVQKLTLTPKQWHAYLTGVATTVPPEYRTFGPWVLPPGTPEDPVGIWAAERSVMTPATTDVRIWAPLRALFEAYRRGIVTPTDAAALVPQLVLLARSIATGRGSARSAWCSVLPRPVLIQALQAALGEPAGWYPSSDVDTLDFAVGAGSGKGRAVASSLVGVAMLATVGVGWVTTSHGHALGTIRAQIADLGTGSTFQLLGASGAAWDTLSRHWWRTVDAIHQALFRMEARYLLGQVLLGPTVGPAELLSAQRPLLEAQLAALIGPVDLGVCYPS